MAAVDYFLKIEGIEGESLQKGHEKQIEIMSFSWGESNTGSFAGNLGGGSGKVSMNDFHFTVPVNSGTGFTTSGGNSAAFCLRNS